VRRSTGCEEDGVGSVEKSLAGRTALVTGGSRGIGFGIAQSLVDRGARVVLTARKPEALAEAVDALGGAEVAVAVPGNAGDPEHRATAVRTAVETFGSLDMLVGNVGINPVYGPLMELDLGAFRKILDTNVVGTLGLVQEAWRAWMAEHGGSVLIVASVAGLRSSEGIAAYGVSKAALINLTTQLAVELGPSVRVNAVAPAVVKTRFAGALFEGREEEVAAHYPLKRLGVPEDVGEAAAYLLGDGAGWITGQTLVIDGGGLSRGPR
jgi:NAD(P)-dependent dehydrogenase (short-subunit alcohol dehydrogenase family)